MIPYIMEKYLMIIGMEKVSSILFIQKRGILVQKDGTTYAGSWENDMRHGKGLIHYGLTMNTFEGIFQNDLQEGYGIYVWHKTGACYKGQWQNGKRHGEGTWTQGNLSYIGTWRLGKPEGKGIQINEVGDRYEGEFVASKKHGNGIEQYFNGDIYSGQYMNGKPQGFGKYIWSNKSTYEGKIFLITSISGSFFNGLRHGKGYQQNEDGSSYKGEFVNDQKCGSGIQIWATGNYYRGHFFNDKRQGYGEMYWVDGSYYKGMWDSGQQNGEGEYYIPNEGIKKGLFRNNILVNVYSPDQERQLKDSISTPPQFTTQFRERLQTNPSPEPKQRQGEILMKTFVRGGVMPKLKIIQKSEIRQNNNFLVASHKYSRTQNDESENFEDRFYEQNYNSSQHHERLNFRSPKRLKINSLRSQSVTNEYSKCKGMTNRSYEISYPKVQIKIHFDKYQDNL